MTQLGLFPDIEVRPTQPVMDGRSRIMQCDWCGTVICTDQMASLGPCPSCDRHTAWHDQRDQWDKPGCHIAGPFYLAGGDPCAA